MGLVQIKSFGWGVIQDSHGEAVPGMTLTITLLDGVTPVTVHQANDPLSPSISPTSDSLGRVAGWIASGTYLVTDPRDNAILQVDAYEGIANNAAVAILRAVRVNPLDYGAVYDGVTDDYAAHAAALAALPAKGGIIELPPGTSFLSQTWNINKCCVIKGAGNGVNLTGATPYSPTLLKFPAGVTGMRLYSASAPTNPPIRMQDFSLLSASTVDGTDDGIQIQTHAAVLDRITVSKFGRYGFSWDTSGAVGNANNSHMRALRAEACRSHGYYTHGANSQAMLFEACDASNNLGWGFYNQDCATNKYILGHSAGNTLGAVYDNGASNQYLGHYVEGGAGNNVTFDTGGNSHLWFCPGSYTNPPITNLGSNNTIFNAGAGNVHQWNGLRSTGDISILAAKALLQRLMNSTGDIIRAVQVSGDTGDRVREFASGTRFLSGGDGVFDTQMSRQQAGVWKLQSAAQLVAIAAASVPNNTIFIDSADNKLKFKDNGGVVNLLY